MPACPERPRNRGRLDLKILFVNTRLPTAATGGAEIVAYRIAEACVDLGCDVAYASVMTSAQRTEFDQARSPTNNPLIVPLSGSALATMQQGEPVPTRKRIQGHINDLSTATGEAEMDSVLRSFQPTVVVTNNVRGLGMGTIKAISQHDALWVHIPHDVQLLTPSGMWYLDRRTPAAWDWKVVRWCFQRYLRRSFNAADILFAPTEFIANALKSEGLFSNAHTVVQHLPAAAPPVKSSSQSHVTSVSEEANRPLRIAFVGRLSEHKGIPWALGVLCSHRFAATVDVCGDGELAPAVRVLAERGGPTKIVQHGHVNASERTALLAGADVVVIPSLVHDNAPLVIPEAAVLGVPVIAARSGGIPEFIQDEWLFRPGDPRDLVSVITKFARTRPASTLLSTAWPSEKEYASRLIDVCAKASRDL